MLDTTPKIGDRVKLFMVRDRNGMTPVHLAASKSSPEVNKPNKDSCD